MEVLLAEGKPGGDYSMGKGTFEGVALDEEDEATVVLGGGEDVLQDGSAHTVAMQWRIQQIRGPSEEHPLGEVVDRVVVPEPVLEVLAASHESSTLLSTPPLFQLGGSTYTQIPRPLDQQLLFVTQ